MKIFLLLFITFRLFALESLPTGFNITPKASQSADFRVFNPDLIHRPNYLAGQAVSIKLSPDKKTLLILTSGFNRTHNSDGTLDINASNEYVFIYDVSKQVPIKKQVIQLANTFYGIAWAPKQDAFYVSGGVDDKIYHFSMHGGQYQKTAEIALQHKVGLGIDIKPMASEIAISSDGSLLAVSNMENDSITLIDKSKFTILDEIDLRPGKNNSRMHGVAGGEFPFGVVFADKKIYVASMRDYELIVLTYKDNKLKINKRIKVGSQPTRILFDKKHHELYVANSRSDSISIIDTKKDTVKGSFFTTAPTNIFNKYHLKGGNPNAMRLKDDVLYVSNGGLNAISLVKIIHQKDTTTGEVIGLLPTGWYPNDLEIKDNYLYIVNGKGLSGSNIGNCRNNVSTDANASFECASHNLHTLKTKKAGFLTMKIPDREELKKLTFQVAKNNNFFQQNEKDEMMKFLQNKIKHVVYVVKENRTYDQILGDLEHGNGDANLTLFPKAITPNHHKLAKEFVTLDNFLDSGTASNDGWVWSTSGHTTEYTEKNIAINYAHRGLSYDNEGQNRNIPLAHADIKERQIFDSRVPDDDDLLPGTRDVASVDGDDDAPAEGYLWDKALKAGLEVRNYGFYCDEERYFLDKNDSAYVVPSEYPFENKLVQAYPNKKALLGITDPYFHAYDPGYPDFWRYKEFKREFNEYVKNQRLPNLLLVRLPNDHFGLFKTALAEVNTPLKQMSDNDYALGLLVQDIANSPFKDSTLIFVIEDDAQDGADHVNSHRSICLVAGPYVKKNVVISKRYTTVNVLKTIEDILNIEPMGLNDALSESMSDLFDKNATEFVYKAVVPNILYKTELKLPKVSIPHNLDEIKVDHDSAYWDKAMDGQNFESEDNLDSVKFNKALWKGLKNE